MARAARARRGLLASAGGSPRWHVMVGEQGGQRCRAARWAGRRATGSRSSRTRSTFGDGSCKLRFSSTCTPGRRCSTTTSIGGGHVDEERVVAVGDQEPGRVVRARIDGGAEGLDGGRRRGMAGESEGELTAGALGRVGTVSQRPIGEPGDDTGLVGRQPRAAADLVAPTEDCQSAASAVETGHRDVGRARRSSRLAATISGIPGTTPLITINRHIGRSVRAGRPAPRRGLEWRPVEVGVPQPAGATGTVSVDITTCDRVSGEPTSVWDVVRRSPVRMRRLYLSWQRKNSCTVPSGRALKCSVS